MSGRRDERGTVTAFVAVFALALLAVAGLVVDGGYMLAGQRAAFDEAEAAARVGAQAVDEDALRQGGDVVIQPDAARQRVAEYLARSRHDGTVEVNGDTVTVHVTVTQRLAILGIVGVGPATIHASGTAHGVRSVRDGPA
ncbi:MAG: hypothetical protein QOK28_3350 [Actinomycetota bacterium]|jgi:uncharacterized membrane protein